MPLIIRTATAEDAATILGFIRDLARYEKAEHEVTATEETIRETVFGENAKVGALMAEDDGRPFGFAIWFFNYSTWQGRNGLYLEDIYVAPQARGTGVGRALMRRLAQIALEEGCGRFEWSVLDWNEPAIRAYEAMGAKAQPEWVRYRLDGEALEALARS